MAEAPSASAEEFTVTATRQRISIVSAPSAVSVVNVERLRDAVSGTDLADVLARVPGLSIQNRQNYAQDTQISARGFGSRASFGIRGIKIFLDDVPATIPDGQAQGAVIPLAAIGRVEVLRGPWAIAYGNAAGGVIAASTLPSVSKDGNGEVEFSSRRGADGLMIDTLRVLSARSTHPRERGVGGLLSHQRFLSDGTREHSRVKREHSYLRVDTSLSSATTLMLSANIIDQPETQDPLGLTPIEFSQSRTRAGTNAVLFNTRKSIRHRQFGAVMTHQLGPTAIKLIAYGGERHIEQFLATPITAQTSVTSAGGVIDLARRFDGLGVRVGQQTSGVSWSIGVDADSARDERRGFENFVRRGDMVSLGQRGLLRRDESNLQRGLDVFASVSTPINERWTAHAGLRHSRLRFEVRDRYFVAANGNDSGTRNFTANSPTVGLVRVLQTGPVETSFYVSAAAGFETPTATEMAYRADQAAGLNTDLQASRNKQVELGYRYASRAERLSASAAAFVIQTDDEIVQSASIAGRSSFQNAAKTSRSGLELSANWRPLLDWELAAAWTVTKAQVAEDYMVGVPGNTRLVRAGATMAAVPLHNLFTEASWRRGKQGWSALVVVNSRSKMAADDTNSTFASAFLTIGGMVNYQQMWQLHGLPIKLDTFLRVDNLGDRRYVGSVIVNEANQRFFEPAPGRKALVGVRLSIPL